MARYRFRLGMVVLNRRCLGLGVVVPSMSWLGGHRTVRIALADGAPLQILRRKLVWLRREMLMLELSLGGWLLWVV
jgi:hypothetical protein